MFSSLFSCLLLLNGTFFHTLYWINASDGCRCPDDLTDDPNLGPLPPLPGEQGSQVPSDWKWTSVLADDLSTNDRHTRNRAAESFQRNSICSILFGQEKQARDEYEAKEREHIRDKQDRYNENMKEQWKKDRMNSLRNKCIISRR